MAPDFSTHIPQHRNKRLLWIDPIQGFDRHLATWCSVYIGWSTCAERDAHPSYLAPIESSVPIVPLGRAPPESIVRSDPARVILSIVGARRNNRIATIWAGFGVDGNLCPALCIFRPYVV